MKTVYIYAITNELTKKFIVGVSAYTPTNRIRYHKHKLRNNQYKTSPMYKSLQEEYNRYGGYYLYYTTLDSVSEEEAQEAAMQHRMALEAEGFQDYNETKKIRSVIECKEDYVPVLNDIIGLLDKGIITPESIEKKFEIELIRYRHNAEKGEVPYVPI